VLPAVLLGGAGAVAGVGVAVACVLAYRHRRSVPVPPAAVPPAPAPVSFADSALPPARRPDPYAGLPDGHLIAPAPRVATPGGGSAVLADWLRNHTGRDGVWHEVVAELYGRAGRVPAVADYFTGVDMVGVQHHFVAALVIVTGHGLTAGTLHRLAAAHATVHDSAGQPITAESFDAVVTILAGILAEHRVPPATVRQVAAVVAPLRVVIATDPDPAIR
jgi:hypothetical protein